MRVGRRARSAPADASVIAAAVAAARARRRTCDGAVFELPGGAAAAPAARPARGRARAALPAADRPGHGQGRRGHRLLPLSPARVAQRGRRRPGPLRRRPSPTFHAWRAETAAHWPRDDARHLDARHQAQRGRARAPAPAVGDPGRLGRARSRRWARAQRAAPRRRAARPRTPSTCFYQTLVGAWPIEPAARCGRTSRRPRARRSRTPRGRGPDARYEARAARLRERRARPIRPSSRSSSAFVGPLVAPGRGQLAGPDAAQADARPAFPTSTRAPSCGTLSLVDPDNRRPVDYALRRALLAALDALDSARSSSAPTKGSRSSGWCGRRCACAGAAPTGSAPEAATSRSSPAARAPSTWSPSRGGAVPSRWRRASCCGSNARRDLGDTELTLPPGDFRDVLSGRAQGPGSVRLAELLGDFPVALLEDQGAEAGRRRPPPFAARRG